MMETPFKMEWSSSFPKARKGMKKLDSVKWEQMANPKLIRFIASIFIVPSIIVALMLIMMALCSWIMSAPSRPASPGLRINAPLISNPTANKAIIPAAMHAQV